MRLLTVCLAGLILAACGSSEPESPTVRILVDAAPVSGVSVDVEEAVAQPLSPEVEAKVAEIRAVLERNSLTRFVRLANNEPTFVSNLAGESHRTHWDLLRRTGFDPLAKMGELLDGAYGTREVGAETWYIWPDLAALEPADLVPERLSFSDRARLLALVGDRGIQRIRDGQGYPGVRTAIAEDGRWLYFVHETEDESED
ncbi:MAG: hypothetical protein Hens3KO_14340 [Henriciella sp.]